MARQIIVEILGDSSKYTGALDKATKKTGGFSNILKGAGMGIGLGMFGMVTSAIGDVTAALGDANEAYMEDVASQEKLKVALRNSVSGFDGQTAAIEKVISAQMRLGFGDEEQRDSLALLVGSTNDVAKAQALQVAAMDLARLKGIDLATATDIMLKANEGNYRGLKSVGIALDANATSAEMLAAVTAVAGGQAEAYANGPLGKQAAAQLKVGESMERIGSVVNQVAMAVLPVAADAFEAVVDVVMEVWAAIEPLVAVIAKELMPIFQTMVGFAQKHIIPVLKVLAGVYFKAVATVVGTVIGVISELSKIVLPALGAAFKWVQDSILTPIERGIGLVGEAARTLGEIFGTLAGKVRSTWSNILGAIKRVINTIIRGWNSLKFQVPSVDLGPLGKVGGFSIGTPNIPLMHQGGIVPGAPGADVPIIAQAGEQIIPAREAGEGGSNQVTYNFYLTVQGDLKARDGAEVLATMRRLEAVSQPAGA